MDMSGDQLARLQEGEVHVWEVRPSRIPPYRLPVLEASLSDAERTRAARFRFQTDKLGFVAARGVLRDLLGRYLQVDPAVIQFQYGPWGKPGLADNSDLQFNLSHSGDILLIGLAWRRLVGVDVEVHRNNVEFDQIAARFFHPTECEVLMQVPEADRAAVFYACWSRKEAYMKATGRGFSFPSENFAMTSLPGQTPVLLYHAEDPGELTRWTFCDLQVDPRASAAVAVEGRGWTARHLQWLSRNRAPFTMEMRQQNVLSSYISAIWNRCNLAQIKKTPIPRRSTGTARWE